MEGLRSFKLTNSRGWTATVLNWGATLTDLRLPDQNGNKTPVVIGFPKPEDYLSSDYLQHKMYLGSSIGRFAGRIAHNRFELEGLEYRLDSDMPHQLHGGTAGLSTRLWDLVASATDHVTLKVHSPHLEGGYPGTLEVVVCYRLTADSLEIEYTATTDRPTIVNLTNHAYFNLGGGGSLEGDQLQINADQLLETDPDLIPTAGLLDVGQTPHDYRTTRRIGPGFVHLDDVFVMKAREPQAAFYSPRTGIRMEVHTRQPAMVVYTPLWMPDLPYHPALRSSDLGAICFECQAMPDAPNQPSFPTTVLEAGAVYSNSIRYRFTTSH